MVERVIGIGLKEQENQTHDDVSNIEYGLPVSSEDVKANVAIGVNIWVVHGRVAMDNWRLMRILRRHTDSEIVLATHPDGVLFAGKVHREAEDHDVGLVHSHLNEGWFV